MYGAIHSAAHLWDRKDTSNYNPATKPGPMLLADKIAYGMAVTSVAPTLWLFMLHHDLSCIEVAMRGLPHNRIPPHFLLGKPHGE